MISTEIVSGATADRAGTNTPPRAEASGPLLSVSRLHAVYDAEEGPVHAVRDVSLDVMPGEFFTLLGPSGCGKTTTLRSVAGFERPDAGFIVIDGTTVSSSQPYRYVPVHRRDIAMVFQSYAIWPHMTVADNVAFPLAAMGVPLAERRKRVARALEMVNLLEQQDRSATQLSGGQQQRVALARAIVKEASLLLLDEPLSNLDAQLRVQMRGELSMLQSRLGTTTLYVTHDQDEALSLSDRIAVMHAGEVIEVGTPTGLYLSPRRLFTARFIGQAELLPASVARVDGDALEVSTVLGPLRVDGAVQPSSRDVTLMIRPEHIVLVDAEDRRGNVVPGCIERVTFTGRVVEYAVETDGGRLRAQALSAAILRSGDNVGVHLPPSRCVVIDEVE